jgi:prevent-host-death family protein
LTLRKKRYSIAAARTKLPAIVHDVEGGDTVELTHRGRPIAVLLSVSEYEGLRAARVRFSDAYREFRTTTDPSDLDLAPDFFERLRDRFPGREIKL